MLPSDIASVIAVQKGCAIADLSAPTEEGLGDHDTDIWYTQDGMRMSRPKVRTDTAYAPKYAL